MVPITCLIAARRSCSRSAIATEPWRRAAIWRPSPSGGSQVSMPSSVPATATGGSEPTTKSLLLDAQQSQPCEAVGDRVPIAEVHERSGNDEPDADRIESFGEATHRHHA